MLDLGLIGFAQPLVLAGLALLPVIWWLLRVTPPAPQRVAFPPLRLLFGLRQDEETASRIPLWLLMLRLALATLLILALAEPVWRPAGDTGRSRPLLLVLDDGWAAAHSWDKRITFARALIEGAGNDDQLVALAATSPQVKAEPPVFLAADEALAKLKALSPLPLGPARLELAARLGKMEKPQEAIDIVWIANGLDHGEAASFAGKLEDIAGGGALKLVTNAPGEVPLVLTPPAQGEDGLEVTIRRLEVPELRDGRVEARAEDGRLLAEAEWQLPRLATATKARLDLPLELRNEVHTISVTGERSAASKVLIDERWKRRAAGLVSGNSFEADQPLLSDLYYLERALRPFADIRKANQGEARQGETQEGERSQIEMLLADPLSVLFLADIGTLSERDATLVRNWVKEGGTLVRFAGPHLAAQSDDLIPVSLRSGGRSLGGALSWTEPQHLAPFEESSPFAGLDLPGDATVSRQVLAEPRDLAFAETWARLEDGTPLVTAAREGEGRLVLFHITANTDWSNLPLSGLFVSMLQRILDLAQGVAAQNEGAEGGLLMPRQVMTGFGTFTSPPPYVTPIPFAEWTKTRPSAEHPPGFYGMQGAARALNLGNENLVLAPLPALTGLTRQEGFGDAAHQALRPLLLTLALILLIADGFAALYLTGRLNAPHQRPRGPRMAALLLAGLLSAPLVGGHVAPAKAADDTYALKATSETHLAYVETGDKDLDGLSHAALSGLTKRLRERTALEPGEPMGVDIDQDELAFFPFLYWPVAQNAHVLSDATAAKISSYMQNGGMILFDTRDQDRAISGLPNEANDALRQVLAKLDVPPLEPVPADHVLTKSFYLLQSFPGRWDGGQVWVEAANRGRAQTNDGVSAIIIGSNDFAGAWAEDPNGRPLLPVAPGGERQREYAYRFGVNLVMYALTGNYKADQVHVPALLERLGQ
jgi:hypothetical protein